ncbi:MAG: hypothetical protein JSS57_13465 [Proteobacteria bacterium]|nr:hypothetical protein [Pseudomonadota bacterium]
MFAEDASLFMDGADAQVVHASGSCAAWLDMPGQDVLGGRINSTEYQITYPASALALTSGDLLTVNAVQYRVRHDMPLDDGVFRAAVLTKV